MDNISNNIQPNINIMQWRKCKKYGHLQFSCSNNQICEKCGDTEHINQCKSAYNCANCRSDKHSSTDRRCSYYKEMCKQLEKNEVLLITNNTEESYNKIKDDNFSNKRTYANIAEKISPEQDNSKTKYKTEFEVISNNINSLIDQNKTINTEKEKYKKGILQLIQLILEEIKLDTDQKIEKSLEINNTNLILLIAKNTSTNITEQNNKYISLIQQAIKMNIPLSINCNEKDQNSSQINKLNNV